MAELTLSEAVSQLTETWTDVLKPEESPTGKFMGVDREPLLDTLRERVGSSLGKGSGGGSEKNGTPLNLAAFGLWTSIDEQVDALSLELAHLAHGSLKERVADVGKRIDTAWRTKQIEEATFLHMSGVVVGWAGQILEMLDGWRTKELLAPCPECGETWVSDPLEKNTREHCLQVHYKPGGSDLWGECKRCHHMWVTLGELRQLGWRIGAQQDSDTLDTAGIK